MSSEIPGVNTQAPQRPVYTDSAANLATVTGNSIKFNDSIKAVASLLAGRGITVTAALANDVQDPGKPSGATTIPALDNPDDVKALEANLEKLISYLQLDNDERQLEMAKERIEIQKDTLATEHKDRMGKINETLDKMDKAAAASKAARAFAWIGAILAVAAAVVVTVVSGGTAAAFAIAGAVVAVGALVMSESGLMDKMIDAIADGLKDMGMKSDTAKLVASLIVNLSIMAVSAGLSVGGLAAGVSGLMNTGAQTISTVARMAQGATTIANTAVSAASIATGVATTALNYDAELSKADVTELEKIIQMLQQRLDESEEELNAIIEAIQNSIGQIADILASETDTQSEIAKQIGQMA